MSNFLSEYGGAASDFSPLDLAGGLILNGIVSTMAAKNPSFRIGLYKDKSGEVPAWADARLVGGIGAAVVAQFFSANNARVRQYGHDAAVGLLNSYVATEQCRSAAEEKMKASGISPGGKNHLEEDPYLLGLDDDDFDSDDDDLFGDSLELDELEEEDMLFAYGW